MKTINSKLSIRGRMAKRAVKRLFSIYTLNKLLTKEYALLYKYNIKTPKGYSLRKFNLDTLKVEVLEMKKNKTDKIILQFHGGAYVMGYNNSYRKIAHRYSKVAKGATVVSIDYRTAPEYKYPAALEDAQKVWDYLLSKGISPNNIVIVGDSAGGNLAVAFTMKLRDEFKSLPKALVLISPWLDLKRQGQSYIYNLYNDPMFGLKKKQSEYNERDFDLLYAYAGSTALDDKGLSPIYGDFHNFPPMLIQVGTHEVLESDSLTLYEKAKAEGVDALIYRFVGMFHCFQMVGNYSPEVKLAWLYIKEFLNKHL